MKASDALLAGEINETQECRVYEQDEWRTLIEYTLFLKHQKAYVRAGEASRNLSVLDFGCGSGYGTAILARYVAAAKGVDASPVAIEFARSHYDAANLTFQQVPPDYTLPFEDNTFDAVTSFQVIEHIPDVKAYLSLLKRVLKPGGKLYITTPNRAFRLLRFQRIWQAAHEREYTAQQLDADLRAVFDTVEVLAVHGNEAFDRIYIDHYRQTPFKAYVRQPIRDLVRTVLPKDLYVRLRDSAGMSHKAPAKPLPASEIAKFSLDDVSVTGALDRALDFFAVCTK